MGQTLAGQINSGGKKYIAMEQIIKTNLIVYDIIYIVMIKTKARFSWNSSAKTRNGTWSADGKTS